MPPVGFEPITPTGKRPQTYALDCAATGTACLYYYVNKIIASSPTEEKVTGTVNERTLLLLFVKTSLNGDPETHFVVPF
jgi:hypothetical protein